MLIYTIGYIRNALSLPFTNQFKKKKESVVWHPLMVTDFFKKYPDKLIIKHI